MRAQDKGKTGKKAAEVRISGSAKATKGMTDRAKSTPAKTVKTAKAAAETAVKAETVNGVSQAKPRRRSRTRLPKGYRPGNDEKFMSAQQREYFRRKLESWRAELLAETRGTILHLQENSTQESDIADRASIETDRLLELRTRDRERKLLSKIDAALGRIEDGSYGYCIETGDPISLKRLEARPIATLGIDAQEHHERLEKTYRDN
jgi:DnaK suppressor protein